MRWWPSAAVMMLAAPATAQAAQQSPGRAVRIAPVPAWVIPPPANSEAPTPPGAPFRILYHDQQVRVTPGSQEEYEATRLKLLTPEALAAGNVAVSWAPANEEVVVHRLAIIRDGQASDVLKQQDFAIIQRENNLEQSMLSGDLTATLQTAGLQVGDEIEFVVTKVRRHTGAGARPNGFLLLPTTGARGAYRRRVVEPKGSAIAHRASADVPQVVMRDLGHEMERQYLLTDPASVTIPDGAPPRYSIARVIQFSGYENWAALSREFDGHFARASGLSAPSPIKAEAARIAAQSADPARRVEAALRLVQDRIRYVYVGLNGGNYRPATADETWRRRYGDCKGKTVLLIALLREMGIAAEPVLVASKGGDGIDERLPTPAMFDHVVVRASVNGKPVWLDGTRTGDRSIDMLGAPLSRWALPLRPAGAALEKIPPARPIVPLLVQAVEIDASAGFDKPGKYKFQHTLRGDEIFAIRAQLAGVASADADKMLVGYWRQQASEVEPARTAWRFDDANRLLVLSMEGEGKVDWEGDAAEGRTHYLFYGGFPPPAEMKRPKDQPQDAAWANEYPLFNCYATTVKLPPAGKGFHWSFSSKPMNRVLGGIAYWRIADFDGTTARLVKSRRVDLPEISAAEAAMVNAAIPGFDNQKSYVWETTGKRGTPGTSQRNAADRFGTFEAFASATPPCQP